MVVAPGVGLALLRRGYLNGNAPSRFGGFDQDALKRLCAVAVGMRRQNLLPKRVRAARQLCSILKIVSQLAAQFVRVGVCRHKVGKGFPCGILVVGDNERTGGQRIKDPLFKRPGRVGRGSRIVDDDAAAAIDRRQGLRRRPPLQVGMRAALRLVVRAKFEQTEVGPDVVRRQGVRGPRLRRSAFGIIAVDIAERARLGRREARCVGGGLQYVGRLAAPALDAFCHADDSGIEVDALDGAPGIYSARYAGPGADDQANNDKLLADLAEVSDGARTARYRCVMVYVRHPLDLVCWHYTNMPGTEVHQCLPHFERGATIARDGLLIPPGVGRRIQQLAQLQTQRRAQAFRMHGPPQHVGEAGGHPRAIRFAPSGRGGIAPGLCRRHRPVFSPCVVQDDALEAEFCAQGQAEADGLALSAKAQSQHQANR